MTVAFVADAETTNSTAGTSVVVSRPSGTASGHVLLAFVACVGSATISTPSGWTLIGTANPGGSVRMSAFYRVADGTEPASWTWTLGASQRNWGWAGCYSGVKTSAPIRDSDETGDTSAGTGFVSDSAELASGGAGVAAAAAVRTATGSATTWTGSSQNERADLSTNGGSGTDIAGMVQDTIYTGVPTGSYGPTWTASQSQTAGAMWAVTLQAEFIAPAAGALVQRSVEVAWGADPDGDPDDWAWTDITEDLMDEPGVIVEAGRDERAAIDQPAKPTQIDLRLRNWRTPDGGVTFTNQGQYTPDNANSANYPNVVQYVPLRIVQPYGYTGETVRYTAFVDSWRPSWDASGRAASVDVTAFGRLQRIRDENRPVHSALYRAMLGISTEGIAPDAYWPMEDGSGATRIASAFAGGQALQPSGSVSFGAASDLPGSDPLPTMSDTSTISGALGPYTATGQWAVMVALKLPEAEPVAEQRLLLVVCTGTAREWSLWLEPGSPASLTIRAETFGSSLLDDSISIVESDHYGKWRFYTILVTQNGANIDWQAWSHGTDGGVGNSGTLNSRTIGTAHTARLVAFSGLSGMGVGHLARFTDPDFDDIEIGERAFSGLDGNDGNSPNFRFQRLCQEEGIDYGLEWDVDATEINMGPQPSGKLGDLLQQPADTNHGWVHDARPNGEVYYRDRATAYNQDPTITLDGNLGQVPGDVRPVFDGSGRITDSTVTRDGGSSARYADPNARGNKPDAKTLSLETDNHLLEIAGWRVALGNQPSMRYPRLPFNLRRNPDLAESWFNSSIGSRMQATNMVAAHGPSDPDGIIVGWRETIRRDNWVVEPVLAPARPYDVPVLESGDEKTWRLDMEGSTLATDATSSDTSLLVANSGDARWGTDVPFDLDVNGERMTATAVASSVTDTFTRTSANGWGSATSGQAWTTANGSASDYSVSSNAGRITNNSTGVLRGVLLDAGSTDVDFTIDLTFPNTSSATSTYERYIIARATDTANHYGLLLQLGTSGGTLTMAASKRVAGSFTNLVSKTAGTNAAGNTWRARVQVIGVPGSTTLYVTARNLTAGTPQVALRVPLLDDPTLTGTNIGVIDRRNVGNTDGAIVGVWDNLDVSMPQTITVTRAVAGGADAKAHTAGETVRRWRARGLAL